MVGQGANANAARKQHPRNVTSGVAERPGEAHSRSDEAISSVYSTAGEAPKLLKQWLRPRGGLPHSNDTG
jgi:hypothetical protein